jgi:signal transduction histidine kinase
VSDVVDRTVASTAITRAVLVGRAATTLTAGAAGLLLVEDPWRLGGVLGLVALITVIEVALLGRWPAITRAPIAAVAVDAAFVIAVLAASQGSVAYFIFSTGAGALAGALLGMWALPLWIAEAALGFAVAAQMVNADQPPPEVAAFVMAFPMSGAIAGVGAAVATAALMRYVQLSVQMVESAQRSAAASERARLARELHDSVAKTLRGISFAALALPSSLRRHPALAEQLASTVSRGAEAAAREARELLYGLRLDDPDRAFDESVRLLCHRWSDASRISLNVSAAAVEPPVAVRYELSRILHEALTNIERHAGARHVDVTLHRADAGMLELTVRDDGYGFPMPDDAGDLRSAGRFGIVGMSERARAVDGTLRVMSAPGQGTLVIVRVPETLPTPVETR